MWKWKIHQLIHHLEILNEVCPTQPKDFVLGRVNNLSPADFEDKRKISPLFDSMNYFIKRSGIPSTLTNSSSFETFPAKKYLF